MSRSAGRRLLVGAFPLGVILLSGLLSGADLSSYRGFRFGMPLSAAVKHSGMDPSEVAVVQQRPALIEELTWVPQRFFRESSDKDPVQKVVFSFYNGQLFRMTVSYDGQKTEGMSAQDLIDVASVQYGVAKRPETELFLPSSSYSEGVVVVARWQDPNYSYNLVQSPYGSNFGLIAFSTKLDELAQQAIASAKHLDAKEEPDRLKAQAQNVQDKLDQTGVTNKARFRP